MPLEVVVVFRAVFTTKEVTKNRSGLAMVYGFVKQSGGHVTVYVRSAPARPFGSTCRAPLRFRRLTRGSGAISGKRTRGEERIPHRRGQ